jgi:hypothetical protein
LIDGLIDLSLHLCSQAGLANKWAVAVQLGKGDVELLYVSASSSSYDMHVSSSSYDMQLRKGDVELLYVSPWVFCSGFGV